MNMLLGVIAAFGGGLFAASIGGLESFIFTGVFSIVGGVAAMCGAADASGVLINYFAFGVFFGPHIAFTAGVAAAAYAKKQGYIQNGADIVTPLVSLGKPDVLLIGGVFGAIGYLIKELVTNNLFAGTISPRLVTDGPGIWVFFGGIIIRFLFGGKLATGTKAISDSFSNTLTMACGYSCIVAGLYTAAIAAGVPVEAFGGVYHVIIFGLAAIGLTFAAMGLPFAGCHHIVIMAAEGVVQAYANTQNLFVALIVGIVFGLLAATIGEIEGNLWNSGKDSHIDPPATAIFSLTFLLNAIFPAV